MPRAVSARSSGRAGTDAPPHFVAQKLVEIPAISQAGERVMQGRMFGSFLSQLALLHWQGYRR